MVFHVHEDLLRKFDPTGGIFSLTLFFLRPERFQLDGNFVKREVVLQGQLSGAASIIDSASTRFETNYLNLTLVYNEQLSSLVEDQDAFSVGDRSLRAIATVLEPRGPVFLYLRRIHLVDYVFGVAQLGISEGFDWSFVGRPPLLVLFAVLRIS